MRLEARPFDFCSAPLSARRPLHFVLKHLIVGVTTLAVLATVASQVASEVAAQSARNGLVATPRAGNLAAEKAHLARYDDALKPLRDLKISATDADLLKAAVKRIDKRDQGAATALRGLIQHPVARKLVDWYRLRAGLAAAAEYREFLTANPGWGSRRTLIERHEEAIFVNGGSARDIVAQFKQQPPTTGAGHAALASAYLTLGQNEEAIQSARDAWRDHTFSSDLEPAFLARFKRMLRRQDHKWRIDRRLMDQVRWTTQRRARARYVRKLLPLLPAAERRKVKARLTVFLRSRKGLTRLSKFSQPDASDWGLAFQRVQALRRAKRITAAAKRLQAASLDPDQIVDPDSWWIERRATIYALLKYGKAKLAYQVGKAAGPLSINPAKDQAFHAGWLALRYLKKPELALRHFQVMQNNADGPLSASKSAYWLGRALEALGRQQKARAAYEKAASFIDTFHAHLARLKLGRSAAHIEIVPPKPPTPAQVRRFVTSDAVKAIVVAHKAKLGRKITRAQFVRLRRVLKSEAEVAMLAHLANMIGDTQMAVRVGKAGVARGFNVRTFSYPVHAFPTFKPLRRPIPEMALLLGLARQESEFNGQTKSGAGARGILQVMPITARHVCRDYKIRCNISRLMRDNAYNTKIATAYVGDRMGEFNGSYLLGIAGYNAGPGRARQWMREFGDPRRSGVDPIDWIHRIPFEETRKYVQKVLSNVQVYRARLGSGPVAIRLAEDLVRGRIGRGDARTEPTAARARLR